MKRLLSALSIVLLFSLPSFAQDQGQDSTCGDSESYRWTTMSPMIVDTPAAERTKADAKVKAIAELAEVLEKKGVRSKNAFWSVTFSNNSKVLLNDGYAQKILAQAMLCKKTLRVEVVAKKHPFLGEVPGVPELQIYSIEEAK